MIKQAREHLVKKLIPFWKGLRDDVNGGYYGYMGSDLKVDPEAVKGCILNSRITWFFSSAATLLGDKSLLEEAAHAFAFMKDACLDREYGGMYWSVTCDGKPADTTKHTYNQAFTIYALAAYYEASGDPEALRMALDLYGIIETRCRDEGGYLEAYDRQFRPASNEKLSENGVMATRTMNTLLHVFEAYTELYRVSGLDQLKKNLCEILDLFADKMYNPALRRQEVFFDHEYNSLIDLWSIGHDIETAWLIDWGLDVLGDEKMRAKMAPITRDLTDHVYKDAFDGRSLPMECEKGVMNEDRVWWIQAETVNGFINGYQRDPDRPEYLKAAAAQLDFIFQYCVDPREGSEWFEIVDRDGVPCDKPIVQPWKCPYHNGRMCMEIIRRGIDTEG